MNDMSAAERRLREAFDRLKAGTPTRVATGSPITQNNIAREAGYVPSAFRGSRFPQLADEVARHTGSKRPRATVEVSHVRCARPSASVGGQTYDAVCAMLVEADLHIIELTIEIRRLKALIEASGWSKRP